MSTPTLDERLVGAWTLVSYEAEAEDGSTSRPLGRQVTGLLVYTADGFVSVHIQQAGRPAWRRGAEAPELSAQRATSAEGYVAYAGRYEVDEAARKVVHHVALSLVPNWLGSDQERDAVLTDDRLELTGPPTWIGDAPRRPRLIWRRGGPIISGSVSSPDPE